MILEAPIEMTLSSYDPVRVRETPPQVTEEMVDAQLAREMDRFAAYEDAPDGALEGEIMRVDMETLVNGHPEPGLTGNGLTVVLDRGMLPSGFVDGMLGIRPGEERTFDFAAHDSSNPSGAPDEFHIHVHLHEKRRRTVPRLTDEFVRSRLSERDKTVAQFRARVRAYLEGRQREESLQRREQLAVSELSRRLAQPLPDAMIESTRDDILESLSVEVASRGMTLAQFMQQQGMNERQFQMSIMIQARESLRQGFALDALARHLGVTVDDALRKRALEELAQDNAESARRACEEHGDWNAVDVMARRLAAVDWLMETATFC